VVDLHAGAIAAPTLQAVAVSVVNALEQMRHVRAIYETAPAPVVATPAMQPAQ
jgi:hypothetical protein